MFQGIFEALFKQTLRERSLGSDYIRIMAAKYYLTDFFRTPLAYITGNGMFNSNSMYGAEMKRLTSRGLWVSDIGLLGNYAIYGFFFILGVFGICWKALTIKMSRIKLTSGTCLLQYPCHSYWEGDL